LNVAFREPLWAPGAEPPAAAAGPRVLRARACLDEDTARAALAPLAGRRGVIVAGPRAAGDPARAAPAAGEVARLARRLGWPILADALSGLRFGPHQRRLVISAADALVRDP